MTRPVLHDGLWCCACCAVHPASAFGRSKSTPTGLTYDCRAARNRRTRRKRFKWQAPESPRIPPSLNTPFFHLLTVAELREHVAFWRRVAETATSENAERCARQAEKRASDWLFFQCLREDIRAEKIGDLMKRLQGLDAIPLAPEWPAVEELEAA